MPATLIPSETPMKFGYGNAPGARVFDVEASKPLDSPITVEIEQDGRGVVRCGYTPMRLNFDGSTIETMDIRFDTIYPIYGGAKTPQLFHCYGRRE